MSSLLSLGMHSSKKEKQYANIRARRHSDVVISQNKKSKKEKDTDTESVSSSTPSSAADTIVVPPPPPEPKCPLRFMIAGMMEPESDAEGKKKEGCPLRRVQLWHTIPLCLLAIINLLLLIMALLGLAGYRITMAVRGVLVGLATTDLDCNPYAESLADTDDGATLIAEKH
jgi:hypothetical protein